MQFLLYTIHHTSYIIHHTSYIIHHTPCIMNHTSYIIHHASYIIPAFASFGRVCSPFLAAFRLDPFHVRVCVCGGVACVRFTIPITSTHVMYFPYICVCVWCVCTCACVCVCVCMCVCVCVCWEYACLCVCVWCVLITPNTKLAQKIFTRNETGAEYEQYGSI